MGHKNLIFIFIKLNFTQFFEANIFTRVFHILKNIRNSLNACKLTFLNVSIFYVTRARIITYTHILYHFFYRASRDSYLLYEVEKVLFIILSSHVYVIRTTY